MKRVAVIGSGISGLAAARMLSRQTGGPRVTLFEADFHFGGHANTCDVTLDGVTHGVDTGFLVCNERTYPRLTRLFAELGVQLASSDMSFSVQVPHERLEWSGRDAAGLYAQRRNMVRPGFWRMLRDIARFNQLATRIARTGDDSELEQPLALFLERHAFSREFRDWYLLPMIGCIWSCPSDRMLHFPAGTLIRFCHNHGLLQIAGRPQWLSVRGGSRQYVRRIVSELPDARLRTPVLGVERSAAGAFVRTAGGAEHFDGVVFACHSDQALKLLGADATPAEASVLGAIRFHRNRAVLHTDAALLPSRRAAWAAWNYEASPSSPAAAAAGQAADVCLHYLINRLQPLPWERAVIVSLNPVREPRPSLVIREFDYAHPVFDLDAIAAQRRLPDIQGRRFAWFCGAWTGYGFHEDGLSSGLEVADAVLRADDAPWRGAA